MARNDLQMAIALVLKGIQTSSFGAPVHVALSQPSTSVASSDPGADRAFLQRVGIPLQLIGARLDYGT